MMVMVLLIKGRNGRGILGRCGERGGKIGGG